MWEYGAGRNSRRMALVSTHDCMQGNAIGEGGARDLARVLELNTSITDLQIDVCFKAHWYWMDRDYVLIEYRGI